MKHATPKELQLAGRLLELASEHFSNHGCNDIADQIWGDMTKDERKAIIQEYHDWNGDPEEGGHDDTEDWLLMRIMGEKLKAFSE